jgi:hypothetical protein
MKNNFYASGNGSGNTGTKLSRQTARVVSALLLVLGSQTGMAGNSGFAIVYADSQAAVLAADAVSGGPILIAQGQRLVQPLGIALGTRGELFITDTGCGSVIGLNLKNGKERVVAVGGILGVPFGIAVEQNGNLLVANAQALVRVDPATGTASFVSSNQFFRAPLAVAVAADTSIYVADAVGAVIRVDPVSGQQTLVASGDLLHRPQGIAVTDTAIYVTDVATADGNFGVGRVVQIDRQTGEQAVLSEGGNLVGPVGITVADGGQLIVGDPYTINEQSPNLFDGGIISVDAATGVQTLISRGAGDFVNPRGVALIPTHGTAR